MKALTYPQEEVSLRGLVNITHGSILTLYLTSRMILLIRVVLLNELSCLRLGITLPRAWYYIALQVPLLSGLLSYSRGYLTPGSYLTPGVILLQGLPYSRGYLSPGVTLPQGLSYSRGYLIQGFYLP